MNFDWRSYWASRPEMREGSFEDALVQVGKTQFGHPVEREQLELLVSHISDTLELASHDDALDLGCGNGILTSVLADRVNSVVGLDYSEVLLASARKHFGGQRLEYAQADLLRPADIELPSTGYSKAWSVEVVQNLTPESLTELLAWLLKKTTTDFTFLASGIPDIARIRAFYDTADRWNHHIENMQKGREQMGYWWSQNELEKCADTVGFDVSFRDLPSNFYTAHYRIDAVFRRRPV